MNRERCLDLLQAQALRKDNDEIVGQVEALLQEARRRGQLRFDDVPTVKIAARALGYGLARMYVDGHLPRWGAKESEIAAVADKTLDLFIEGILRDGARRAKTARPSARNTGVNS